MFTNTYRTLNRLGLAAGATMLLAGGALAQSPLCPTPPKPYGPQLLDVSRNLAGQVSSGITYFFVCQNAPGNGLLTRNTYRQPIHLDMNNITGCDELGLPMMLDGYYYSQTRLNDPFTGTPLNPRIGWHNGFGSIKDSTGNVIATAKFEGTIGTNTSRPPLPEGGSNYSCYVCGHHTGQIVITFLNVAGAVNKRGTIKAFYQFDAYYQSTKPCDDLDPCLTDFFIDNGTLDGINFRVCQ